MQCGHMVQAYVDPSQVRQFAQQLRQHSQNLQSLLTQMNAQLQGLGQTWRDVEYQKFKGDFDNTARMLRQFTNSSDQYAQFLVRKAGAAEQYLQQK